LVKSEELRARLVILHIFYVVRADWPEIRWIRSRYRLLCFLCKNVVIFRLGLGLDHQLV
jgi:hypothetical protein